MLCPSATRRRRSWLAMSIAGPLTIARIFSDWPSSCARELSGTVLPGLGITSKSASSPRRSGCRHAANSGHPCLQSPSRHHPSDRGKHSLSYIYSHRHDRFHKRYRRRAGTRKPGEHREPGLAHTRTDHLRDSAQFNTTQRRRPDDTRINVRFPLLLLPRQCLSK